MRHQSRGNCRPDNHLDAVHSNKDDWIPAKQFMWLRPFFDTHKATTDLAFVILQLLLTLGLHFHEALRYAGLDLDAVADDPGRTDPVGTFERFKVGLHTLSQDLAVEEYFDWLESVKGYASTPALVKSASADPRYWKTWAAGLHFGMEAIDTMDLSVKVRLAPSEMFIFTGVAALQASQSTPLPLGLDPPESWNLGPVGRLDIPPLEMDDLGTATFLTKQEQSAATALYCERIMLEMMFNRLTNSRTMGFSWPWPNPLRHRKRHRWSALMWNWTQCLARPPSTRSPTIRRVLIRHPLAFPLLPDPFPSRPSLFPAQLLRRLRSSQTPWTRSPLAGGLASAPHLLTCTK